MAPRRRSPARARPVAMLVLALGLGTSVLPLGADAAPNPTPTPTGRTREARATRRAKQGTPTESNGSTRLTYVAGQLGYFELPKGVQLAVGDTVQLVPRRGTPSPCVIVATSRSSAACKSERLAVGLTVTFADSAITRAPSATETKTLRAQTLEPAELEKRQRRLDTTAFSEVVTRAGERRLLALQASAALAHTSFMDVARASDGTHRERLELALSARDFAWRGSFARLRASAITWAARPADSRFERDASAAAYLWEAVLGHRARQGGVVAAVGRLRPAHVSGLPLLDGAQVGYASSDGKLEAGVLGGALPEPLRLSTSVDRWTAGAYVATRLAGETVRWTSSLAALYAELPSEGAELVASGATHLSMGPRAALGGSVQFAVPTDDASLAQVTAWSANGVWHASDAWTVDAQAHGVTGYPFAPEELGWLAPGGSLQASLGTTTAVTERVQWGVRGGAARPDGLDWRAFAGPELTLAGLLPWSSRLSFDYLAFFEPQGTVQQGSIGWSAAPRPTLTFDARTYYRGALTDPGLGLHEVGAFVAAGVRLAEHLALTTRVSSTYARILIADPLPLGIAAQLVLRGEL